jgi:ATP-dependent Clp protease ATP-binding subunit ClpA
MTAHHVIRSFGRWLTRRRRAGPCGKGTAARTNQSGNFDRFTERARTVMQLAQEEAQRLQHNSIGTEHLLLGLLREREGVAGKVFTSLGVDLDQARQAVEGIVGRGEHLVSGEIHLTPRAKKVVELAVDEARRLHHHFLGTEHLLLGMLREGQGIGARVLESFGLSLQECERTSSRFSKSRGSQRWCAPFVASSKTRCSVSLPDPEGSLSATNVLQP